MEISLPGSPLFMHLFSRLLRQWLDFICWMVETVSRAHNQDPLVLLVGNSHHKH